MKCVLERRAGLSGVCARDRQVLKESRSELKQSPEDGCYIDGLFIEGAAFDMDKMTIVESKPKPMPGLPVTNSGRRR